MKNRDLDVVMCIKHQPTDNSEKNLHWMELAIDDPLFKVKYTGIGGSPLYAVDITQNPPTKEGVRNMDFEIVYPLFRGLNEIIESTKTAKTSQIKLKVSAREHREAVYTSEFRID